jgi:hypothetical protein
MKTQFKICRFLAVASFWACVSAAAQTDDGFKPIFNGKDLTGWDGDPKFWSVEDGAITGRTTPDNPTRGNTFIIWREGKLDDFVLRLRYRIVGGNSGIQYRSKDHGNWVVGGYQADFEAGPTYSGIMYEERGPRGIMAQRGEMAVWHPDGKKVTLGSVGDSNEIQNMIRKEDWNDYLIIAQGTYMTHIINGRVTSITIDEDPQKQVFSGILAIQLHAGPPMVVQVKDIELKPLEADAKQAD